MVPVPDRCLDQLPDGEQHEAARHQPHQDLAERLLGELAHRTGAGGGPGIVAECELQGEPADHEVHDSVRHEAHPRHVVDPVALVDPSADFVGELSHGRSACCAGCCRGCR